MERGSYPVREFMSYVPTTVDAETPLWETYALMRRSGVLHLPVTQAGKVYGMLCEPEVRVIERIDSELFKRLKTGEVCSLNPHCVEPDMELQDLMEIMDKEGLTCVLVTEGGRMLGVFSALDALKALFRIIQVQTEISA